ncbi:MAG TPA: DEAD/DEAH box helicase [bacterium]|nr:DEAD/DEAH box helicase [bacterium]
MGVGCMMDGRNAMSLHAFWARDLGVGSVRGVAEFAFRREPESCYTMPMGGPAAGEDAASVAGAIAPDAALTALVGIGPKVAARLEAAGLRRCFDLVMLFPRRCRALRELAEPEEAAIGELVRLSGAVHRVSLQWLPGRRAMVTVTFACDDGSTFAAAFFNQPWLKKNYPVGQRRQVEGVLQRKGRKWLLGSPRILPQQVAAAGEVQLRYPEVDGVSARRLQQWIAQALDRLDWSRVSLPELPRELAEMDLDARTLLLAMHRPRDVAEHDRARRHFAVREALHLFRAVERAQQARAARRASRFAVDAGLRRRILQRIPFALTADQRRAVEGLWQRLAGPGAMGVLLQGDVGTGKTAVAVAASLAVAAKGGLSAFLLPTELLAEQQCAVVRRWLAGSEVQVVLCTASERRRVPAAGPRIVFGTHALLAGDIDLPGLSLVVVDEQQRFGVGQRMALVQKGANPHVLVMTATPIPRTLALVLFGDLDLVMLRHRPPGRRPVPAMHVATDAWPRAVRSIARAVRRGGRVFVVCPAVGDDGEKGGVMRVRESLVGKFRCGVVHGRMKAAERQRALARFRDGIDDVLIGTTVLEVGIDVPDATLIVVVAADRFGIATLHQLRGRVGRGRRRGLALLCGPRTARVDAVCRTTDGFALAEADLALRGSGELLGTQQSGFADLRALDPIADLELLRRVRDAVRSPIVEAR